MKHLSFAIIAYFFSLVLLAQDIQTFQLINDTGMKALVSNYVLCSSKRITGMEDWSL